MKVRVEIWLKSGVLDPQGAAIGGALSSLGFTQARSVRVGKVMELDIEAETAAVAQAEARRMCEALLANPVIEDFTVMVPSA